MPKSPWGTPVNYPNAVFRPNKRPRTSLHIALSPESFWPYGSELCRNSAILVLRLPRQINALHNLQDSRDTTALGAQSPRKLMAINDLEALEDKVDELIALCEVLVEENQVLKSNQQNWTNERAKLVEKNESAKARVESMIARLKALDK